MLCKEWAASEFYADCVFPGSRARIRRAIRRSATKRSISCSRSSSGLRRMADGWMVASTCGASGEATSSPRRRVTRKARPSNACAAVAPRPYEHARLDACDLRLQPRQASTDLARVGPSMQSSLAAWLPLEMLDDVGDVGGITIDAGIRESSIEQTPRRSDKGSAGKILVVPRCFADQHERCMTPALAKYRLRGAGPQPTPFTAGCRLA